MNNHITQAFFGNNLMLQKNNGKPKFFTLVGGRMVRVPEKSLMHEVLTFISPFDTSFKGPNCFWIFI